jgi:hypothetical protein
MLPVSCSVQAVFFLSLDFPYIRKCLLSWIFFASVYAYKNVFRVGYSVVAFMHTKMSLRHSIRVITKLPNSEQSYKGKVKTHKYINRQD